MLSFPGEFFFPDLCRTVQLLIDYMNRVLIALEYQINQTGGPNVVKSLLAWSLVGPIKGTKIGDFVNLSFVQTDNTFSLEQMQAMCNRDFITKYSNCADSLSVDDRNAIKIMNESVIKKSKHFLIVLPWKSPNVLLQNNKQIAIKRFDCFERKLAQDPNTSGKFRVVFNNAAKCKEAFLNDFFCKVKIPTTCLEFYYALDLGQS